MWQRATIAAEHSIAPAIRACNNSPLLAKACVAVSAGLAGKEAYDNYGAYQRGEMTNFGAVAMTAATVATTVVPAAAALRFASHGRAIVASAIGAQNVGSFLATDAFRNEGGGQVAQDRAVDTFAAVIDGITRGNLGSAVVQTHTMLGAMGVPERLRQMGSQMRAHAVMERAASQETGEGFEAQLLAELEHQALSAPSAAMKEKA